MRLVLVRPPRFVWPFNSETSAFWQPLGFACLAGAARQSDPRARIEIWDCPAERIGWRTLARRVTAEPIDVLGIGEETVSAHEGLRAAELVRSAHPNCLVVAGGTYYSYAVEETLNSGAVDVIIRGEGERTVAELLARRGDRTAWAGVAGIAFRDGSGRTVLTPPRPLVEDMDDLPAPAWDLLDMSAYGRGSRNHPALTSIEHSRGCVDRCSFCILWRHMGRIDPTTPRRDDPTNDGFHYSPCYRTKSAQRSYDEVLELHRRFNRRTFGWVDPTFNGSPEWTDGFAERVLGGELMDGRGRPRTLHTAWLRADGVIRDQQLGVLAKLVRAGLRQVMIGVERDDEAGLASLDKHNNGLEITGEAFAVFREKYPEVFTIGTMIFGLPGDTGADLDRLIGKQFDLGMDYCFLMPLTPNPGTPLAAQARAAGRQVSADLAAYNFHTPVLATESMGPGELESAYYRIMLRPDRRRVSRFIRNVVLQRDLRKRRVSWAMLTRGTTIAAKALWRRLTHPGNGQPTLYSRKPSWYDK